MGSLRRRKVGFGCGTPSTPKGEEPRGRPRVTRQIGSGILTGACLQSPGADAHLLKDTVQGPRRHGELAQHGVTVIAHEFLSEILVTLRSFVMPAGLTLNAFAPTQRFVTIEDGACARG